MKRWIYALLLALFGTSLSAQELMINGGFEQVTSSWLPGLTDGYEINYANGWHRILYTPDVSHPNLPYNYAGSDAYEGVGCGRFGGNMEYAYGTTLPLVAGQTYEISYYVSSSTTIVGQGEFGVHITSTQPSNLTFDKTKEGFMPQIKPFVPLASNWRKITGCFTAKENGAHYLIFGGRGDDVTSSTFFYLDNVSVKQRTLTGTEPLAVIDMPDKFCLNDALLPDGTLSQNETSYQWELYKVHSDSTQSYLSNLDANTNTTVSGQPGIYDLRNKYTSLSAGCYNLYLYVNNDVCSVMDKHTFCFEQPYLRFINNGDPVCENELKNLQVSGEDDWTYTWSTGESGTGLKSINGSRPNAGTYPVSVTITTTTGCTASVEYTLIVHSANNVAPTMDGINGTGEYTIYVRAGQTVNFSSFIYNNPYETVTSEVTMNISGAISNVPPLGSNQGTFTFNWSTPSDASGEYSFSIHLEDNNRCGFMDNTYTFRIIVICDHCPICVDYENRTPFNQPLPELTKAGKCITAGLNQPVKVGTGNNVTFRAGYSIELGAGFDTDGGVFLAEIDTTTCIDDCNDCCTAWTGFTYDEIPNGYTLNFADGDPTNDYFEVTDSKHPYCAFNAVGYSLRIYNQYNNNLYYKTETFSSCCAMQSASQDNPIAHSPIYWDGYTKNIWGSRVRPTDGTYFYEVHLYGCNGQEITKQGYLYITSTHGMALKNEMDGEGKTALGDLGIQKEDVQSVTNITLSPNPTADFFVLSGIGSDTYYQLFDESGRSISGKQAVSEHQKIDIRHLPAGMYYCRIYIENHYRLEKLVKL